MDPLSRDRHGERPTLPASSSSRHAAPPDSSLLLPLQEKGFHSLVFLSFSVPRNITVLYSSVLEPMNNPQPTNIATYIHHRRLTDECIRVP
jgi:hypothetical protein